MGSNSENPESKNLTPVEFSQVERNQAETAKLKAEAEVIRNNLQQKWYNGNKLIQAILASFIGSGLLAGWVIGYLKPILTKKQELFNIELKIREAEYINKISKMTALNESLQVALQEVQNRTEEQSETTAKLSKDYSALSKIKEISDQDRVIFSEKSVKLEEEKERLQLELEILKSDLKEIKQVGEEIYQQQKPYSSIINSSGSMSRVLGTSLCKASPYITILSDGSLSIGLNTTSISTQHANLLVKDMSTGKISRLSIKKGDIGIYNHNSRFIRIKINSISECEVGYEIN